MLKKQNGRSMVEVIGVIGILAILSIGAIKAIDYGMGFYRANEVKIVAEEMIKKIEQFAVWERGYDNLGQNGFGPSAVFCNPDHGFDFPNSFCNGLNVDADKLEVHMGQFDYVAFDNHGGGNRINRNAEWTVHTNDDTQHFTLVFKVGREACRQLRKAENSGEWRLSRLRQVAPLNNGAIGPTFCSKFFKNQFIFEYPAD